uniref:Uncharacterized protein n=1 Tax=Strix occidentalis caurina TaxID=311401 RepID=A0A8D0FFZ0_STROC
DSENEKQCGRPLRVVDSGEGHKNEAKGRAIGGDLEGERNLLRLLQLCWACGGMGHLARAYDLNGRVQDTDFYEIRPYVLALGYNLIGRDILSAMNCRLSNLA